MIEKLEKKLINWKKWELAVWDFMSSHFKYATWVKLSHPYRKKYETFKTKFYNPISQGIFDLENEIRNLKKELEIQKHLNQQQIKLDLLSLKILKYLKRWDFEYSHSADIYSNVLDEITESKKNKVRYRLRKMKKTGLIETGKNRGTDLFRRHFKAWGLTNKGKAELLKRGIKE